MVFYNGIDLTPDDFKLFASTSLPKFSLRSFFATVNFVAREVRADAHYKARYN